MPRAAGVRPAAGRVPGGVPAAPPAAVPPLRSGSPAGLLPDAPPLPARRLLTRALAPLKLTVGSRLGDVELDEAATAERAAQDRLWLPECRPVRERRFDLDVIVDDGSLARLHRPLYEGFVDCLTELGAFRTLQVHLLDTDQRDGAVPLLRGPGPAPVPRPATGPGGGLAGVPAGRHLVIVLTDGAGAAWHSGAAQRLLARWGATAAVAVVCPLPQRTLRRTGLAVRSATVTATAAGTANGRYRIGGPAGGRTAGEVCVPVLGFDPDRLHDWAELVACVRPRWHGRAVFCAPDTAGDADPPGTGREPPDRRARRGDPDAAAELVDRFRAAAPRTAFDLAVSLAAAAPLNTHVMRLIQRELVPRSGPSDLTELLGSGLLQVLPPAAPRPPAEALDAATYDFVPGARAHLLAEGRRSHTARVLTTLSTHLGDLIPVLGDLGEVVAAPGEAPPPNLTRDNVAVAAPLLHALRALSGKYTPRAKALERSVEEITEGASPSAGPEITAADTGGDDDRSEHAHPVKLFPPPPGVGVTIRDTPPAPPRSPEEPPPIWGNIPARNRNFVGRDEILELLHERLSQGTTAVLPEALHGMGGVGKSQIAIEYAHRHSTDYDLVWWIPAERPGQIQQALTELASQLNPLISPEANVAVPAVREALRLGRPYRNWLLIFDNAEQLEDVQKFFPTNGPGKILVTSRNQAWTTVANSLEVDIFKRVESKKLLNLRGPGLSDGSADELASLLGDLPLAIEQAAVWLYETGMPVDEYLTLFKEKHDRAVELLGDTAPAAYDLPVAAAWNVSLDQLRESNPGALRLLQVCSFFAPEPISRRLFSGARHVDGPPELLDVLGDPIKLSRAFRAINQYALAKISHGTGTIALHRLVQRVLIDQLTAQEAAELKHCGHQMLAQVDPGDPALSENWSRYADLLPHVQYSGIIDCDDKWAQQLVLNEINFLWQWGNHDGFLGLSERVVRAWTDRLGDEAEQTLAAGQLYGRALRILGRFTEAYEQHLHVRDIFMKNHGPTDERTLEAQTLLGADLRYLGRFTEALELDRASYEVMRRRFGPNEPMTLDQAHLLAIDLRLTGDPRAALELDTRTRDTKALELGENHLKTMATHVAVAIDELELGRYTVARDQLRQIEQRYRTLFGEDNPGTIETLNVLAVAERKTGAHERAAELSEKALATSRIRYGDLHPGTLAAALNHAISLRQIGDLEGAVRLSEGSGRQYAELFGPDHPNTPTSQVNLAVTLRLGGRPNQALQLDEAALANLTRSMGEEHPRSIVCAINLASDLAALGRVDEALERGTATMAVSERILGEDHPTSLACSLNLAFDMLAAGTDEDAAKARLNETLTRYREVFGPTHPATLAAVQSIRADCDIYPIPV
ncbi:tetratricopeptide repeat protein [Actinomadura sp. PM05-2]|uniref:Tetratricopeptide repeat protein n=2 Tax=Actinomadura parmotrematis TaxID=2864039 RepID=A0ABS7G4X5_9ACTN|nr:tetratricopeptide repeat protein [Actinomadura parmotrematis]